jgi:hypothetical protein
MISTPISLQPRQGLKICAPAISARSSGPTRHLAPARPWQSSMFTAFRPALVKSGLCRTWSPNLGANLYFARLKGHGRSGDAMLEGSVQAWVDDFAEAVAIGRRLGRTSRDHGDLHRRFARHHGPQRSRTDARCRRTCADFTQLRHPGLRIGPADHALGGKTGAADCRRAPRSSKPKASCMRQFWTYEYPSARPVADGFAGRSCQCGRSRPRSPFPRSSSIRRWIRSSGRNWSGTWPPDGAVRPQPSRSPTAMIPTITSLPAMRFPPTTERLAARTAEWISGL